jgi:hypothetical protein
VSLTLILHLEPPPMPMPPPMPPILPVEDAIGATAVPVAPMAIEADVVIIISMLCPDIDSMVVCLLLLNDGEPW